MSGKPVAEQEMDLLYCRKWWLCRNFMSRRKFCCIILVKNLTETGEGADMDDNVRNPKVK
jgi:ATP-dependent DNA helicase RecQ